MFPILTILAGLLTAAPLILSLRPGTKKMFDRMVPYQGFFGVGVLALGIVWLLRLLPHIAGTLTSLPGLIVIAMIATNILLGFLLGFGLISKLLAKNETAKAKSTALLHKLRSVQIPMGVAAMVLGVVSFVV